MWSCAIRRKKNYKMGMNLIRSHHQEGRIVFVIVIASVIPLIIMCKIVKIKKIVTVSALTVVPIIMQT